VGKRAKKEINGASVAIILTILSNVRTLSANNATYHMMVIAEFI
jgi:hypothetical protein